MQRAAGRIIPSIQPSNLPPLGRLRARWSRDRLVHDDSNLGVGLNIHDEVHHKEVERVRLHRDESLADHDELRLLLPHPSMSLRSYRRNRSLPDYLRGDCDHIDTLQTTLVRWSLWSEDQDYSQCLAWPHITCDVLSLHSVLHRVIHTRCDRRVCSNPFTASPSNILPPPSRTYNPMTETKGETLLIRLSN